jgi:hypothetical protein
MLCCIRILACKVGGCGLFKKDSCLGLIMVYVYLEFALPSEWFKVARTGILCLGLMLVHVYYEFALRSMKFKDIKKGVLV